jgi:hypothetical protein
MEISLPYNFDYREYQKPQFIASTQGIKRFIKVWHRRAGKDITDLNFTIMKSMERKAVYWHLLPEYEQAKKAIWEGMTKDGRRYIDHFPAELIKRKDSQSMMIELINGSIWRLVGSDRIDKAVGAGPAGVVFSEYSLSDPTAWGKIEPMLLENNGWASFNFTPRGKNHAFKLLELAKKNPKWFTQVLTIDDTLDIDGNPIVTEEMIHELRVMGTDEETIQQEYYCSFEGSMQGAYYTEQLRWLEKQNKIIDFPILPEYPVYTYWDIGKRDYTTIWFVQEIAGEFRIIDYYYVGGGDIDVFAKELQLKGYRYEGHYLPHDAGHLRVGMSGKTVQQQLQTALPTEKFHVLPVTGNVNADIVAARAFLRRCAFHKTNTSDGVEALHSYVKKWNDKANRYDDTPVHNWASHAADSFRELAIHNLKKADTGHKVIRNATEQMRTTNRFVSRSSRRLQKR